MMKIVFYSKTGKVKRFANKLIELGFECIELNNANGILEPYILITPTVKIGEVPQPVMDFLRDNHKYMIGVASSGNKNWGENVFAKSGELIAEKYSVPLVLKFENSGSKIDVNMFKERAEELCQNG